MDGHKVRLHGTGNYIHSDGISHKGKEYEKESYV